MNEKVFIKSIELVGNMFTERLFSLRSSFRHAKTFDALDKAYDDMIDLREVAMSTLYKMCAPFAHIILETVEIINVRDKYIREINRICEDLKRLDDTRFEQLHSRDVKE